MAYLTWNAFVINDAAKLKVKEARELIESFRKDNPNNEGLAKRSNRSYLNEWAVHALAYRWGIMQARSKDADCQFDMEPEVKFMYAILGPIARLILKFCKPLA